MLSKLCRPEDMLRHFPNGSYIGWSGFTGVGYPKYAPPSPRSIPRNPGHIGAIDGQLLTPAQQEDPYVPRGSRRAEQLAGTAAIQPLRRRLIRC